MLRAVARIPARAVLKVAQTVSGRRSGLPVSAPLSTDRLSISVPGVHRPEAAEYRDQLCGAVLRISGVSWAAVNAPLQRLVIGVRQPAPSAYELLAAIDAVQETCQPAATRSGGEIAEIPEPPDDDAPIHRAMMALAADLVGLTVATVGRFTGWIPGSAELASLVTFVDTQPKLRGILERALGRPQADTALALTNAAVQAAVQGTAGLSFDTALRIGQLAETRARRTAWCARQDQLLRDAATASAAPVVVERPRPLPDGPVEHYAPRTAGVAGAGAGVALLAGSGPRRAAAIAVAMLPKAAGAGREAFAAHLGWVLAQRGAHVMDRQVLRRLERIDTVVLDAPVLTTGRHLIAQVHPLPGCDLTQAQLRANELFSQNAVEQPVEDRGWQLGPVEQLRLTGRTAVDERRQIDEDLGAGGKAIVLGLAEDTRLKALVVLTTELARSGDALIAAARRCDADLVFTGGRHPRAGAAGGRELPGGQHLLGVVRQLQAEGRVVLLVSDQAGPLGNADCGIGIDTPNGAAPWGAHVLVGTNLEIAALLIDAVHTARTVARRGVQLAEVGAAIGAVTTLTGKPRGAARRALLAVNGAGALSLAQGIWAAVALARRPISPPVSATPWHALPVGKVLGMLGTATTGLSTRQAQRRYQPDSHISPAPPNLAHAFAEELANPLTPILAGGAALSAAIGSTVDAVIIVGASVLGAVIGAVQKTTTGRAVAELLARSAVMATVRRDETSVRLRADELVLGDIVVLQPGDVVPADCRLVEADGLEMDESSLTGESFPVDKALAPVIASEIADRKSMVFEGTTVAAGRAVAIVVATGASTEAGRGTATAEPAAPASGVHTRLAQITHTTLPIALGSGAAVMTAGLLRGRRVQHTVSAGVGLAVASVPEGLPFLVSAAQLAAAKRLSRKGALVRNAHTIEPLGCVDVLCFDKTGTLTQGRIRLAAVADSDSSSLLPNLADAHRRVLAAGLRATPAPLAGQPLPHLTDRAVREGVEGTGVCDDHGAPGWRLATVLPFEPSRGYHATAGTADTGPLLSVKGAPEIVLPRCTTWYRDRGTQPLTPRGRRRVREQLNWLTSQGYRVLAVAEADHSSPEELTEDCVRDLCFLGFLALADPVRASAGASLDELRSARTQIVMITGDHPTTAEAIAKELGILDGQRVITGADIDALDDEQLAELVGKIAVVARGTPAHKVRVVRAFQAKGRVVAMTGDGANDAPAIRLADVGIALGQRATPAARAAADLVVTDDRLETIIAALVEGRAMWKAVREALAILVGGNLGEIGFTVLGASLTGTSPLNARQLLLVNLLTDLAPALAIALRKPDPTSTANLLTEGPTASLGVSLTREMTLRAAATTIGAAAGWFPARLVSRDRSASTVALASLVGTQLAQTLLIGRRSPAVLFAGLGSAGVLAMVIQIPGISQFFGCSPLGPVGWSVAVAAATGATLAAAALPVVEHRLPEPAQTMISAFLEHPEQLSVLAHRWLPTSILSGHPR